MTIDINRALPDYLPLSFLNQICYCPRRFWLMFAQSEMEINALVLEGQLRHQRADTPGRQTDEQGRTLRSVQVWSDVLRVAGVADFVQERDDFLVPLEHKRGRMGRWLNDHVQLCAQAICLEERTGTPVLYGEIFYWANRRRERVAIDTALRAHTHVTIQRAFALLQAGRIPAPIDNPAKCTDCSLEPICLPRETRRLIKEDEL
jgi:CRISPR-associated exonuclease Cas4